MGGKRRRAEYHLRKGDGRGKGKIGEERCSVLYMTESRRPRTEPWGTPQGEVWKEERLLSHLT